MPSSPPIHGLSFRCIPPHLVTFAMGFPSTAAHTNYLVGGHYQDMQPYKFGASSSSYIYPPLSYNNAHQYSPTMTRQAQTLRDATSWWEEPNGMPRMTIPTMYAPASWASAGASASASTYHYPHCQPSYQHHLAPPLRSIHNTRCAQGMWIHIPV